MKIKMTDYLLGNNRKRRLRVYISLLALTLTLTFLPLIIKPLGDTALQDPFHLRHHQHPDPVASRAKHSIHENHLREGSSRDSRLREGKMESEREMRGRDAVSLRIEGEGERSTEKPEVILDYDAVFNTTTTRWPLVVFSTMGRLGNCLSSYATALTFAARSDVTIAVTQNIYESVTSLLEPSSLSLAVVSSELLFEAQDLGVAEVVQPDYLHDDMTSHLLPAVQRAAEERAKDATKRKIYILEGYPNRMKMLAGHHSKVRSNFQIRDDLKRKAMNFLDKIRKSSRRKPTFIGFHIRRKDYVKYSQKFHNCSLPSSAFYHDALDYYRARYAHPLFVVASDDLSHARQHLADARDVVFSEMSRPEEDLALLASCSHSIMTAGSFGFWASYLAGGEVLYAHLKGCSRTPWVHPDTVSGPGFERWREV
ncbi:galactoside alpha-(1,2)-fucosyltransferase 2-like [Penaeus japonicus]|uniref:galactoside alpha-(1,2)-fucosyltransferase 2-like n=1 Tax=Penaeus japonicus TaxID=27405 RepID=UPI001C7106E2|nr:galactoside alpha-(1,2)-fucosyltransferase 2-like [Penaeus japonicus]